LFLTKHDFIVQPSFVCNLHPSPAIQQRLLSLLALAVWCLKCLDHASECCSWVLILRWQDSGGSYIMRVSQQSAGKISWVEFSADSHWGGCWGLAGGGVTFSAVSCTPGLTVAGRMDSIVWGKSLQWLRTWYAMLAYDNFRCSLLLRYLLYMKLMNCILSRWPWRKTGSRTGSRGVGAGGVGSPWCSSLHNRTDFHWQCGLHCIGRGSTITWWEMLTCNSICYSLL
jgi:hypothetical protein